MIPFDKNMMLGRIHATIADMNGINLRDRMVDDFYLADDDTEWLFSELQKKEAAGSPIRIDTESISDYEFLAQDLSVPPQNREDDGCGGADLKALKKRTEENFQQCLPLLKSQIDVMCAGCYRRRTIVATSEGIRCACLSESFFLKHLATQQCSLKSIR